MRMLIDENIEVIKASENPLSADVVFIKENDITYIYDVGASDEAYNALVNAGGKRIVILSHFHEDHVKNLTRFEPDKIYASKETIKHIKTGDIVNEMIRLDDIALIPLPSSHCKGCIALLYRDYLFVGDALYPSDKGFNRQIMDNTISTLEKLNFKYFCISHRKMFVNPKEAILRWLKYTRDNL